MARAYGVKSIIGDSACPSCRARGGDRTGNHLQHWENSETKEKWVHCSKCGHHETLNAGNQDHWNGLCNEKVEKSPEEIQAILAEVAELPIKELKSRGIKQSIAERYNVRVGLSYTDGETPISHYYPKTIDGVIVGHKVRNLEHKSFWSVGKGTGVDLFGINQARLGDIWSERLYIFEDELSAMSGFQAMTDFGKGTYKPACVSLPNGATAAASAIAQCSKFVERFKEIVICMDNDEAGEEAFVKIRAMIPRVLVARIPKGVTKEGKAIKDANDMLMDGRVVELNNLLRFNIAKESPAGSATVLDCLDDAMKKPEYGLDWPWPELTDLTFGLRYGEVIAVGGGVGGG
ncbi:MAG: toprim domain-containing protein [Bacteroidales bacterium]